MKFEDERGENRNWVRFRLGSAEAAEERTSSYVRIGSERLEEKIEKGKGRMDPFVC